MKHRDSHLDGTGHVARCEHVWHDNPALITPCPECGEGEEPNEAKEEKTTTVYITKYALTKGIHKDEAARLPEDYPNMAISGSGSGYGYFHGNDWHLTKEAAIARAKEMQVNKIKSLEKQLKKIKNLKFEIGRSI